MALVITLLVVALITAMVVEFAYGVFVSTSSLHNWQTSQKLSVAARSATKLAGRLISSGLLEKTRASYEMSQKIPYDDPEGTITVRIEDEGAKLNLNNLDGPNRAFWHIALKTRLLPNIGLNPELADRIAWWIRPQEWLTVGKPEDAKGGKLDSINELLLIPGMDKESYEKLLPYVTIFGDGTVNINTAAEPVLKSLHAAIDSSKAQRIIAERELKPFSDFAKLNEIVGQTIGHTAYMKWDAATYHVSSFAESAGIRRIIESVVEKGGIIKFWRES